MRVDSTAIGFGRPFWRGVLRPLTVGTGGWPVPLLFGIGVIAGAITLRRRYHSWTLPLTMFVAAGAINWLESVVGFSHFTPQYFGRGFVAVVACCLTLYQFVVQLPLWTIM